MSGNMRDAVVALKGAVAAVHSELRQLRHERETERHDTPELQAEIEASRRPLHRLPAANVLSIPALAVPFTKVIPESYWRAVALGMAELTCVCGAVTELQAAVPTGCSGECERWFLLAGRSVRVAEFEDEPADA